VRRGGRCGRPCRLRVSHFCVNPSKPDPPRVLRTKSLTLFPLTLAFYKRMEKSTGYKTVYSESAQMRKLRRNGWIVIKCPVSHSGMVEHSGQASQSRRSFHLSAGLNAASCAARSSTSATDFRPNCIVLLTVIVADLSWCSAQHVRRATTGGVEFKRRSKCLIRHISCLELS